MTTQINYKSRSTAIDPKKIMCNSDFNTRRNVENIDDLAQSILTLGQTTPVGVVESGDNYELVWGFRRMSAINALIEAGHDLEVIADVLDKQDANKLILLNVQENVSREQLTLSEEFNACKKLSAFMTKEEIAEALGVTKTWITSRMKLGDLSEALLNAVDEGLSVRAAQAVNLLPEELHEEYSARAVGQSVSTVADMVQARLDEIAGIDPTPSEDNDDDLELLDDDQDLTPLDEDFDDVLEDDVPESDQGLKDLFMALTRDYDLSDDDKEQVELLIASIRWTKVIDADKFVSLLGVLGIVANADESDLDDEEIDADEAEGDDDLELLDDDE